MSTLVTDPPSTHQTRLDVEKMHCASCTGRVERALLALPDVSDAAVNLANGTATIHHGDSISAQDLAQAVTEVGYPATAQSAAQAPRDQSHRHADEATELRRNLVIALVLTLPVFLVEMGGHVIPALHHGLTEMLGQRSLWFGQMILTAAVLAVPGRRFFQIGLAALWRGAPEMNSLVALGAGAAFLYSSLVTLAPTLLPETARHVYFEAAALIVTLILMGRWLEARAKGQAGEAIRHLIELAPDHAGLISGGTVTQTPVAELREGDLIRLLPGERVALDGEITEGTGHLDESMLTGEAMPVPRGPGDRITGGTLNGNATLTYRITATGADTVLSRIVGMVADAQATKLPVQALVDRVTRVFVPIVMGLSLLTLVLWLALGAGIAPAVVAAVSVLIIACPCAMGLAVPVSIMVGTGRGAELGVLFRRGDALQRLAEARTVAFDKTGTLTQGRPILTDSAVSGITKNDALRLAAAAEIQSEHPLAAALIAAAGPDLPKATEVTATPGQGLSATVEGQQIHIGNLVALKNAGIAVNPALGQSAQDWSESGATPVHLAVDGIHVAAFALADEIREQARQTISGLHELGLRTVMISGDLQRTADAVGRKLDIDEVRGEVPPEGKLRAIRDIGKGSIFVGDGINDAPALAGADTGIAIGTGTDIAIESADVVLMHGDPSGVVRAVSLSRAVMSNIRQNLFWAFAYNVALVPVAMGVLVPFGGPQLSPILAAGAMALSSVFVVTNALRLRTAT